jgi:hypothetical protein
MFALLLLQTAPFKLTDEMVDVLGGLNSALFGEFVTAFTKVSHPHPHPHPG